MAKFQSQSKFYGDKCARTMEQAFGPGASLYPTRRHRPGRIRFALFVAAVVGVTLYLVRHA